SNGTLARNIVRFGWAQYIGTMTNGQVTDKTRLAGHDLTRVSGILSKLLLDIVLGEHDAKISSFRIGDMNIDVLAATKHIPVFGKYPEKNARGKTPRMAGKQTRRAEMGKSAASNPPPLPKGFNAQKVPHLPEKLETVRR